MRTSQLFIPRETLEDARAFMPLENEIVKIIDNGKIYVGDGFTAIDELTPLGDQPAVSLDTTDDTPTTILNLEVADYTAGSLSLRLTAVKPDGSAILLKVIEQAFTKVAGSLYLPTPVTAVSSVDAALSTTDIDVLDTDDHLDIQVTGIAATNISWHLEYKLHTVIELPAP